MINTSAQYKEQIKKSGRRFYAKCEVTLATGTILNLVDSDFQPGGLQIYDITSASNQFEVGHAGIVLARFILNNLIGKFNSYDFNDAIFRPQIGLQLPDNTIEWLYKGAYKVYEPVAIGTSIHITALDNMQKFDRKYDSPLVYPATLAEILRDTCTRCGVVLATQTFLNSDYVVAKRPADDATTYRDIVSYVAQLAACWARCNNLGELVLGWYDMDRLHQDSGNGIFGGDFSTYDHSNVISGGDFTDYPHDDILSGGVFRQSLQPPADISSLKSCTISTDDVRVTGVQIVPDDSSKPTYFKGTPGYVVSIEKNLLAQDNLEQLTANIAAKLVDFRFRPMQVSALDDPSIEAGDVAWVTDPKGHRYATIISNLTYTINSSESFTADAETQSQRQSTRFSAAAKAVQTAKQEVVRQISNYDLAVQQLASTIALAAGTFQTVEKLDDGSQIVYLHDKPTLAESQKIWKHTANAFAVSNDGGVTWRGMDADGNFIAAVLSVIGINCDWIQITGKISSPVNPNVYFDVSAGVLAASRLVASDNSGIYADVGTEEPQYGTAKGLFLYDKSGKFAQIYKMPNSNPLRHSGAQLLSLGDFSIYCSGGIANGSVNVIDMQKDANGYGRYEFDRALADNHNTMWLYAGQDKTTINFNPSDGHNAFVDLYDNVVHIGTNANWTFEVHNGGGLLAGTWNVEGSISVDGNVNVDGSINVDGINKYNGWIDLQNGRISFGTAGVERGSLDNTGWYGVFNQGSDRAKKTNIEPVQFNALDRLKMLNFYSYNYLINDINTRMATITGYEGFNNTVKPIPNPQVAGEKTYIGIMADEAPTEIASFDDNDKPIGINLYEYISLVAKSVLELNQKVESLLK